MMAYLRSLLLWVLWLIAAVSAVMIYLVSFSPVIRDGLIEWFNHPAPELIIGFGQVASTCIIIIVLLSLWCEIRLRRRVEELRYSTAEGEIIIALATIDRFIADVISRSASVKHVTVDTEKDDRKVNVHARVKLDSSRTVAAAVTDMQTAVRRDVQAIFGLDLLRDIHIEVARVTPAREESRGLLSWNRPDKETDTSDTATAAWRATGRARAGCWSDAWC